MCGTRIPFQCEKCSSTHVYVSTEVYYTYIRCLDCGYLDAIDNFDDDWQDANPMEALDDLNETTN